VISDLELQVVDRRISITISDLPDIEGIPSQIRQVFQNLLSNAIKFSRNDIQSHIEINSELVNSMNEGSPTVVSRKYCRISIRDNGIGFSNEFRARIFEIFQRLNDRKIYDGTGIGLSIVKKIVERHGGTISASGKQNEGATFTVILPVKYISR
jgi:signal transduction histidine kinase